MGRLWVEKVGPMFYFLKKNQTNLVGLRIRLPRGAGDGQSYFVVVQFCFS